jgi:rhomboid protease GluP
MMRGPSIPRRITITYILIALNVAVYVYTSFRSGTPWQTSDEVLWQIGQVNYLVMNGWYWQLFTSMFVHVTIEHIVGNMLFLLIFGLRAEEMFDVKECLLIYILSGLAGNLLTLLFGPNMVSAGASGAIFGMFGAVTIYMRRAISQSIMTALIFAFFLLLISSGQGVNVLAHLGGLVVGLLMGYFLAATRKPKKSGYTVSYSYST